MKKDYTHVAFLLDRSGSMRSVRLDTIGGFNTFIEEQKKLPGEATFTLAQFSTDYEVKYNFVNIQAVPELTELDYYTVGGTALYDSVARLIQETGQHLASLPEEKRPEKVVVVIQTDGFENASVEYQNRGDLIAEMIKHQREKYAWEFMFLGADQDAILTAQSLNIVATSAMTYTKNAIGTQKMFESVARSIGDYRTGAALNVSFKVEDYQDQTEASVK